MPANSDLEEREFSALKSEPFLLNQQCRPLVENAIREVCQFRGYNLFAIPLAAGVLYPNFVLSPAMGAVLMSVSTVIVAFNAQLLRRNIS